MAKLSAGILLYRLRRGAVEVLLVHPGGPFWAKKDDGAWSIPKGEYEAGDDPLSVARREFEEELGSAPPAGEAVSFGEIAQPGGKRVTAFALQGDFDPANLRSNDFELEWPPRTGLKRSFPEIDRAAWFSLEEARVKILKGQAPFLDRLLEQVGR